jgi:Flp pilus assembly protein TadG
MKPANGTGFMARMRATMRSCVRSDRGSVTIEFVICIPLFLLVLVGMSEIYLYMRAVSLVEHTAFTLADSLGQMTSVIDDNSTSSSNNLGSIWKAAITLNTPNDLSTNGAVYVTSICEKTTSCAGSTPTGTLPMTTGVAKILWQKGASWNSAGLASSETNSSILPSTWPFRAYDTAIVIEVMYRYTPFAMTAPFWTNAPGQQTIYERVYVRPRSGQTLPLLAAS